MAFRTKMSREDRAQQFMPFAALKGYPEALRKKEETDWSDEKENHGEQKSENCGYSGRTGCQYGDSFECDPWQDKDDIR